jgi:hypothetical protein
MRRCGPRGVLRQLLICSPRGLPLPSVLSSLLRSFAGVAGSGKADGGGSGGPRQAVAFHPQQRSSHGPLTP